MVVSLNTSAFLNRSVPDVACLNNSGCCSVDDRDLVMSIEAKSQVVVVRRQEKPIAWSDDIHFELKIVVDSSTKPSHLPR